MATTTAATPQKTTPLSNLEKQAVTIGGNYTSAEDLVLQAYSLKEGAPEGEIQKLAKDLGVKFDKGMTARGLQTVAEQRYQRAGQIMMLFSSLLDKMNQLKDRLISNIGR